MADDEFRDRIKALIETHHRALNMLESHLGCVICRGALEDGRCIQCDPPATQETPE